MKKESKELALSCLIVVVLLIIDQIIKISVKTNMCLGESIEITKWFNIAFIENMGMAWGITFFNKLTLSIFRILAISILGYYIYKVIKTEHRISYVICLSVVMAGATGNIFDSMLYGLIFSPSTPFCTSTFVPFGEGYSSFLMGKVVDMFYFPIVHTTWPDWMPIVGGDEFVFFSPVFNFADSCITVGMFTILIFFRKEIEEIEKFLPSFKKKKKNSDEQ